MVGAASTSVSALLVFGAAVLTLIGAGVLAVRRGRNVAQQEATDTFEGAANAWESRYRAQQEELAAQTRRIDDLTARLETADKDRAALRAQVDELKAKPDYDTLLETVREMASNARQQHETELKLTELLATAVDNEVRLREHAHNLGSLGHAIELRLEQLVQRLDHQHEPVKGAAS